MEWNAASPCCHEIWEDHELKWPSLDTGWSYLPVISGVPVLNGSHFHSWSSSNLWQRNIRAFKLMFPLHVRGEETHLVTSPWFPIIDK